MTTRPFGFLLSSLVIGACGSVDDPPASTTPDGSTEPTSSDTDEETSRPCDLNAPFQAPLELASLNSDGFEWAGMLSADRLTAYFGSNRGTGDYDILTATRATPADPFGPAILVEGIESPNHDDSPTLSPDGLTMIFHTDRTGGPGGWDLYIASRPSLAAAFSQPAPLANQNEPAAEITPYWAPSGTLYFSSSRTGTGDIYRSTRGVNGAFSAPTRIAELSTDVEERNPVVTADELTIYFNREGDIWRAHRSTTADGFGPASRVAELNTPDLDLPVSVSADGCTLYVSSKGHAGSTGGLDIFSATRPQ